MTGLSDHEAAAGTLACLPEMTPRRLRALVERFGGPVNALARIGDGAAMAVLRERARVEDLPARGALAARWQVVARSGGTPALLAARGTRVYVERAAGYPIGDDVPGRPAVLLAEGDRPDALEQPRVAVVGTRAATPHGLADAHEIGAVLADAGVAVVSGLAIGIDAAAHVGALDAGGVVVGVVATGLDVVYPRRHASLFERVRRSGLLVSELGYGVQPLREHFPVRNRIIAALAEVTVVVEATLRGGARITAEHALDYGRPVLAMPGSRRNPAAAGTNALIADGAHPLLEPADVLVALGLTAASRRVSPAVVGGDAGAVLRACGGEAATLDQLASRSRLEPDRVATLARELERSGHLERAQGMWWPR